MKRRPTPHTTWCARGHHCGLGEHRSAPVGVDLPGLGRGVLIRVADHTGRQHAELRLTITLTPHEQTARDQLATLLTGLTNLLTRAALAGRRTPPDRDWKAS